MTELTRRQMRELERSGQLTEQPEQVAKKVIVETPDPILVSASSSPESPTAFENSLGLGRPMTRRELRLRAEAVASPSQASSVGRASALSKSLHLEVAAELKIDNPATKVEHAPDARPRLSRLPAVGESRRERRKDNHVIAEQPASAMESIDVEIPEDGLRGANYLGELSTQSIVLETAPEALSLSVDTGEIFTTGSIAILPDSTGSVTGSLDGVELDSDEAVTGVISIVDPVSAKDLIDQRSPLGVVPSNVLRKGWWRPWAVGVLSVIMALAAILASITIFNALGD